MLCYQDFKDTFVCNTQQANERAALAVGCVIRISKILLYAIHNNGYLKTLALRLCYQDFKDTFVCNTQPIIGVADIALSCVIRISKILLYAIHNSAEGLVAPVLRCVIRISKILLYAIHNTD